MARHNQKGYISMDTRKGSLVFYGGVLLSDMNFQVSGSNLRILDILIVETSPDTGQGDKKKTQAPTWVKDWNNSLPCWQKGQHGNLSGIVAIDRIWNAGGYNHEEIATPNPVVPLVKVYADLT